MYMPLFVLLLLFHTCVARSVDEIRPSFVRSAIESNPWDETKWEVSQKQNYKSLLTSIGTEYLPLRTAVEDVPFIPITSRIPLRDAVEFRPLSENSQNYRVNDEEQYEYHRQARQRYDSNPFAAYIMSSTEPNYANTPPPYRADSPFQQLVDRQTYFNNRVKTMGEHVYSEDYHISNDQLKAGKDYKVFCHMTNWAFYREDEGKFVPENIDAKLCSHILYSFATLDPQTLTMKEFDPWGDIENELYKRTINRDTDVPVLLSLGGWTDSTGDKYSRMIGSSNLRKKFITKAVDFLKQYGFAGLHFDWNYPVCWQSDCKKGPKKDKSNFATFIEELSDTFYQEDLILSVAISGYKEVIQEAYDLRRLSDASDFLVVMTYDYHGAWEPETGHIAPLYARSGDKYPQYNVDYAMNMLIKGGVDKSKIIMGVPFYGQTFTLTRSYNSIVGEGTPASGTGHAGLITKQPGMLAYHEICRNIKTSRWLKGSDPSGKSGPYAMKDDQWVSYDDQKYLVTKSEYVMRMGFGGIAAWTIDFDDYHNNCCQGPYPLLKTINRALGRVMSQGAVNDCTKPPEPVTPVAPTMSPPLENGEWRPPAVTSTTWPSWSEKPTTKRTTTRASTTTTTTKKPTTTTTKKTTTQAPVTTRRTTTRKTTTTTVVPSTPVTTPPTATIPPPAVVAPSGSQGQPCDMSMDYSSDPSNCNAYYRCVSGTLVKAYCPGGLHWRSDMKLCDWPANAKCTPASPPNVNQDEEIEEPASTTTTTRKPARPSKTSKRPTKITTVVSTLADIEPTQTTRRTTRKTTTTTRRSTTTKSTTLANIQGVSTTKPSKPPKPTRRKCESGNRYPHRDCSKFYICINGKKVTQTCPPGYQWSQKQQTCDLEKNVRCVSKLKLIHLRGDFYERLEVDDTCDGNEFLKYWASCTSYLQCDHGQIIMRDCPDGLEWNDKQKTCDWPANANCQAEKEPSEHVHSDAHDNEVTSRPTRKTTTVTTTTTTTPKPMLAPFSGDYKLVCYFTNWAWYRRGIGKYMPEHIDTDLCTHIVYGFAVLDYSKLTIRTHDSWADIDNKFYTRVTELKNKGVKVSLALGGWNDSLGDKYSRLVRSAEARARFVTQSIEFMEKYGFEGLDLDWEYPVCWQVDCKKGFPDEKEGFTSLVRELSAAFKPKGYLLSSAVSPSKTVIDAGYDVPELSKYFDWIAVMCYDYHGQWDKKTGHVAPLYYHPDDDIDFFNTNFTINYWIELGAPRSKLVMGMPLYGQSFQLENKANNGLNARAPGPGQAGEFTRAAGFLAYYEICDRIKNKGWTVVRDSEGRMGPYAYNGNQWVSFDDQDTLKRKSHFIRKLGLGGGMIWALDLDDFKNRCGEGHHPLLRTIRDVLAQPRRPHEEIPEPSYEENEINEINENEYADEIEPQSSTTVRTTTTRRTKPTKKKKKTKKPTTTSTTTVSTTVSLQDEIEAEPEVQEEHLETFDETVETSDNSSPEANDINQVEDDYDEEGLDENLDFKVVCYFTNWAWYRQEGGKYLPEDIDTDLCTHIVYGFAVLDRDSLTIKTHDSWADLDNEFYSRVVAHKQKGTKVTVAIGGWNDSAGDKYSRLVRDPAARARFIRHVMSFIERYDFDGLDLDWEYPVCWQVDCKKGYEDEKEAFTALVKELSEAFKPKGYLLSTAVSPSKKVIDAGYEVSELSKYFDWIAVMTYDFHGQWDKKTGHVAPMYEHPDDFDKTFNANFSINYWIQEGAPPRKIVMGIPMYGQSFSLADNKKHGLNAQTYGGGEAGPATRSRGFLSYYEICRNIREKNWKVVRDLQGRMGPYAYLRDQWVSFDDILMVQHKSEYIKAMGLGGAMIWALDLDDFRNICDCEEYPLLKTINRALRKYPQRQEQCTLEPVKQETPTYADEQPTQTEKPTKKPTRKPTRKTTTTTTASFIPESEEMSTTSRPSKKPTKKKKKTTTKLPSTTTKQPDYELIHQDEQSVDISHDPALPENCDTLFVPHETDCRKYYMCNYGKLFEQTCPAGLHWNNQNYCDWPMKAGCQMDGQTSPATTTKKPRKTTSRTTTPVYHDDGQQDYGENDVETMSSTTTTMKSTTKKRRKKTRKTTTTTTTPASNDVEYYEDEVEDDKPLTTKPTTKKPSRKPSKKPVKPPSTAFDVPAGGGDFKVVCYFTNWAWYRPGEGKYVPDDINTDLCTHIVYGFAVLDREKLTIRTHDSWADIDNKFYTRVSELKAKGIKVTLALGGWNDSLGDKYSRLVRDPNARSRFVTHAVEFVEKYGFQGLDLDWEYPVCWQVDCKKGFADEKEGFAALVEELAVEFRPRGLLLSSAVSPSKMVIDAGYDIPSLAVNFDWIAVMTYDFHGHWDKKTGHVAPLYEHPEDEIKHFNGNFSINYWIEKGCPPSKLVMGVPMYGQSFSLADQSQHGLNAKSYGPGEAGRFTRAGGFLAFYEICSKINAGGWTVVRDLEGRMGPYAYKGSQWVSYDDVEDIKRKTKFIRDMKLGGGMIWALDLDDFRGTCGCGKHPLLKILNAGLGRGVATRTSDCT